jgi:hypothetical protein
MKKDQWLVATSSTFDPDVELYKTKGEALARKKELIEDYGCVEDTVFVAKIVE